MKQTKPKLLEESLAKINRSKTLSKWFIFLIGFIRSLCLAGFAVGLWEVIRPGSFLEEIIIFLAAFIFGVVISSKKGRKKVTADGFVKHLEFKFSGSKYASFELQKETLKPEVQKEWGPILNGEVENLQKEDSRENLAYATTITIPLLLLVTVFSFAPQSMSTVFSNVRGVVSRLQWGANIEIIDGMVEDGQKTLYPLKTSKPIDITLLEQNLVKISLVGQRRGVRHIVRLVPLNVEDAAAGAQGFQLIETLNSKLEDTETGIFALNFTINNSSKLYISSISDDEPLATVSIKKLPVPTVQLEPVVTPLKDPWPDDKPLRLKISAKGENPLAKVRLIIQTGGRVSTELVTNILAEDKKEAVQEYDLLIEPYMKADIAEVAIIAEAVDRSLPNPLLGRSKPLRITAASAYGRYQRTLQTLRELKVLFDNTIEENKAEMDRKAAEIVAEVQIQAQESPFFDQFDRAKMFTFDRKTNQLIRKFEKEELLELSAEVNDFLFEHEAIDFRERDRDFFVAVRGLSRLLEQARSERPVKASQVTERISDYLEERRKIWDLRVKRLPQELVPLEYARVKKKEPYKGAMKKVAELDEKNTQETDTEALQLLSKTAADYRQWIQKLEEAEDNARKSREQKRQQGLSSARNQLKELQKRQSEISSKLDKASTQNQEELSDSWPATRMKQSTNQQQTKRLENMLRSLSPLAAKRMEAAMKSMGNTIQAGDQGQFVQSESSSDTAARLLRQAESAAKRSQKRRGGSRGRRRRVSGDNYYGRSITGGDIEIKRVYSVDKRYRGEILNDVRARQGDGDMSQEDKNLLESYLRQIVR